MKSQKNILKSIEGLSDIELFVIDLFCGAGGLSEGVEEARLDGNRCGKVVCCVNHDKNAILSKHLVQPHGWLKSTENCRKTGSHSYTMDLLSVCAS